MKIRYYLIIAISSLLIFAGCQTESELDIPAIYDEEEGLCDIEIGTRGIAMDGGSGTAYQDTTYRAQLFYRGSVLTNFQRLDSLMTPYTGTYCNPKGTNTWLTPCAVDGTNYAYDSSASPAEDSQYGLRAGRYHDYYLFMSSPAMPYVKYSQLTKTNPAKSSETALMEYYGLNYLRGGDAKDHPAISAAAKVTTTGLNLQSTYKYALDDTMELKEYRSRIAFSVRCGDAIDHCNFKKLEIKGMRKNAVLRPFTKDFYFVEDAANYEDVIVYESPNATGVRLDRGGTAGAYTEGDSQSLTGAATNVHLADTRTNTYFTYVLSDDYKSLDKDGQYIKTPANLCLTIVSDDGNPITMDPIPMGFIYEPQKSYFYLITINSVYLSISVTTQDWTDIATLNENIDNETPETIVINIKDWTAHTNSDTIDNGGGGGSSTTHDTGTSGVTTGNWNSQSGGSGSVD